MQEMQDIPFADSFRVEMKYTVESVSETSCRVNIGLGIHFTKSNWFKGKKIIEERINKDKIKIK